MIGIQVEQTSSLLEFGLRMNESAKSEKVTAEKQGIFDICCIDICCESEGFQEERFNKFVRLLTDNGFPVVPVFPF